jgi:hypothetical protein
VIAVYNGIRVTSNCGRLNSSSTPRQEKQVQEARSLRP